MNGPPHSDRPERGARAGPDRDRRRGEGRPDGARGHDRPPEVTRDAFREARHLARIPAPLGVPPMPAVVARCTIVAMSSPLSRLLAVCGALLALAIAAPAAMADSIAYIKGGDVWLSTGDGSRQYRVTTTGRYADVSQADDGTMIALTGVRLHRLDRQGNVLADFDTPVSDTRPAPAKTFYGPFDPAISPDGTKVAYTYHYMTQSQSPTCFPPTCFVGINEGGTGYSWADRQTGWDDPALGKHSGWRNPVWVDEDTDDAQRPHAHAELRRDPRHAERRRLGQPRPRLVQRHGRGQPAHERRRHHARPREDGVRHRRERQHAHRLLRSRSSRPRSRTATRRSRRARPSATATAAPTGTTRRRPSRPTAAGSHGPRTTASRSSPCRASPAAARSTARRRTLRSSSPAARSPTGAPPTCPPAAAAPAAA